MSRAILKIRIKDHENTDLFLFFLSFLELKSHCSVAYGTIVIYLFSKQTGKVENFRCNNHVRISSF